MTVARSVTALSSIISLSDLTHAIFTWMSPYNDTLSDCEKGIYDALEGKPAPGGFVICATENECLVGALVMLSTGMSGYIPPNLLLFVAVDASKRKCGIGTELVKKAIAVTNGAIKLHVEADNPAKRLYEKLGFSSAYLDMRLKRSAGNA